MKEKICVWIVENADWIREVRDENGSTNFMDVVFEQPEFEELCDDLNTHTSEEGYYVKGLTNEKASLITGLINKVFY